MNWGLIRPIKLRSTPQLSGKSQCLLWLLWKGSGPPLNHPHIVSRYFFLHHLRHTILKKSAVLKLKRDLSIWWMNSNPWINIMAVFAVTYKTGSFQMPENLPSSLQLQISCFYVFFFLCFNILGLVHLRKRNKSRLKSKWVTSPLLKWGGGGGEEDTPFYGPYRDVPLVHDRA